MGIAESRPSVRADFVPKSDYLSPEVAKLENDSLWPSVWQIACRVEEIPKVGDFVTFEIVQESILVVRVSESTIKAYFNVCQHRGRRLKEGCGNAGATIFCRFHGWRWKLDGSLARVRAREDWAGSPDFNDDDLRLKEVLVDVWGGAVFINMNPRAEPLREYLAPVPEILDPFLLSELRFNWYKTLVMPCNWKTAVDAFNEGYHTEATHPQMNKYGYPKFYTKAYGRHAMFYTQADEGLAQSTSTTTDVSGGVDARKFFVTYIEELRDTLKAMYTDDSVAAARRMLEELPAEATPDEVAAKFAAIHCEITQSKGANWPVDLTAEAMVKAGIDWHIFPNTIVLPTIDGALWYRARPNGVDINSCIFDVWSLGRYKAGTEPVIKRELYERLEDFKNNVPFLEQDFENLLMVQKGMQSRGFAGARTNPRQEVTVSNFHRVLHEYIYKPSGSAHAATSAHASASIVNEPTVALRN
jgi:phenylpropionate dioxygenase-like ring-hydroxylating dioxygenase large terminal subunit